MSSLIARAASALIVGGGVFGISTALALSDRGVDVTVVDPGPLPHPLAASTDISKVVRMEYGADAELAALADRAIDGWEGWNRELAARGERPLYHASGVLFARLTPLHDGTFEAESDRVLAARGHTTVRLDAAEMARRFPLLAGGLSWGVYNPRGGFAEAERTMAFLAGRAARAGVTLRQGAAVTAIEGGEVIGRPVRVRLEKGDVLQAEQVLVTTGAWTPFLLPETASQLQARAQPIFQLQPRGEAARLARPPHLPVFGADLSSTGYYGFPAHPVSGVIKIGRHSQGRADHPGDVRVEARSDASSGATIDRRVGDEEQRALRAFLEEQLPALAALPLVASRTCFYSDTRDGQFLIDRLPGRPAISVATGDSGHAFKFAPVLGDLVADLVAGSPHPLAARFRWRDEAGLGTLVEAARHRTTT